VIVHKRSLAKDEDGVTVLEFAFVFPVMFLFVFGLLEVGYVLFARSTLESSVLAASRESRVADCPNENAQAIEDGIRDRMSVIASADGQPVQVTVESYGQEFGDVGNPEPYDDVDGNGTRDEGESYTDINGNGEWDEDMGEDGDFGSFGEVVRFTATYNVPSLVPWVAAQMNDGNDFYTIRSVTVVRNEPFIDAECAL